MATSKSTLQYLSTIGVFVALGLSLWALLEAKNATRLAQDTSQIVHAQTQRLNDTHKLIQKQISLTHAERKNNQIIHARHILAAKSTGSSGKKSALELLTKMGQSVQGINLSCAAMGGWNASLNKCDSGVNLKGINLSEVSLNHVNLSGARIYDANFKGADLSSANLAEVDLGGSNLTYAMVLESNLSNAKLNNSNLSGANFSSSNLSGATLSSSTAKFTDFLGVNFSDSNLNHAILIGAGFALANLSGANLEGADLSSAMMYSTNFRNTKVSVLLITRPQDNSRAAVRQYG